jgi:hypothetical protein
MADSEDDAKKQTEGADSHISDSEVRVSATERRGSGDDNGLCSRKLLYVEVYWVAGL